MKSEFDSFKITYELGKLVNCFIDNSKFEGNSEESKFLKEENKIYCIEITKILFDNERGIDHMKRLAWRDLTKGDVVSRYLNKEKRSELDKLQQEWEIVKYLFDSIAKISTELDISFHFENYKDKKLLIISHTSYDAIKQVLAKNIKHILENIIGENFRYSMKTVEKMKKFSDNLIDLKDIIDKLEQSQNQIEKNFGRLSVIQKRPELFLKLKQVSLF